MTTPYDPLALAAGDLCHVITILQPSITTDVSGSVTTYTTYTTTRAKIEPMRGTDLIKAGQDATETYINVSIRYQPGLNSTMRVQTLTGTYIIQDIENLLERNRVLKLLCLGIGAND